MESGLVMNTMPVRRSAAADATVVAAEPGETGGETQGNILRRHIIESPRRKKLARHRLWMDSLQHEYPTPYTYYRIGVYIRYYNQTSHENYLEKHIQQFTDDIALCRRWTLVDFYIDRGMNAPRMEHSKEWCRLLEDCFRGKVNLIVTQKVSSVSSDPAEMSFIARILAALERPVGIYFISEDIFTLASYYREDLRDRGMFPAGWKPLPDEGTSRAMLCGDPEEPLLEGRAGHEGFSGGEETSGGSAGDQQKGGGSWRN